MWSYTNMPPKPYKLFLIEADYRKKTDKHPVYEFCAKSTKGIKKYFKEVYGLDVISIKEAPEDYQPNEWYIEKYGKERLWESK